MTDESQRGTGGAVIFLGIVVLLAVLLGWWIGSPDDDEAEPCRCECVCAQPSGSDR